MIDPDPVGRIKIVADVDVREPVPVDVPEHDRETPIIRRFGQRFSVLVEKRSAGERNRHEICPALVAIEYIRFPQLLDAALGAHNEPVCQVRPGCRPAIKAVQHHLAVDPFEGCVCIGHVHQRRCAVVGDIEIQTAIAIDVAHRQRHASPSGIETQRRFGEMPFAVIEKETRSTADRVDYQVQVAVPVKVGKRGSGRVQIRTSHTGGFSNIKKLPVAQISVQRAWAAQVAEKQIDQTVPIHIPRRHSGTIQQHLVGQMPLFWNEIRERDSRNRWRQSRKARFSD